MTFRKDDNGRCVAGTYSNPSPHVWFAMTTTTATAYSYVYFVKPLATINERVKEIVSSGGVTVS